MTFFPRLGLMRSVPEGAWAASTAVLTGDLQLGEDANIWFGSVLRGDDAPIVIGRGTNIQDLTMVHADPGVQSVVGEDVTVGHGCLIHGAEVGDRCLIGMGAILLAGSRIGSESIVAAGAVVLEGTVLPPRSLVAGVPAKIMRQVTDEEAASILRSSKDYVVKVRQYLVPEGEAAQ